MFLPLLTLKKILILSNIELTIKTGPVFPTVWESDKKQKTLVKLKS